ncbi:hypothetical protein BC829DRAFT_419370 [Chytridium lagenaria]|nr:hypothetical protein BC829DRAFT_419370 [Chytridium lagenaria]
MQACEAVDFPLFGDLPNASALSAFKPSGDMTACTSMTVDEDGNMYSAAATAAELGLLLFQLEAAARGAENLAYEQPSSGLQSPSSTNGYFSDASAVSSPAPSSLDSGLPSRVYGDEDPLMYLEFGQEPSAALLTSTTATNSPVMSSSPVSDDVTTSFLDAAVNAYPNLVHMLMMSAPTSNHSIADSASTTSSAPQQQQQQQSRTRTPSMSSPPPSISSPASENEHQPIRHSSPEQHQQQPQQNQSPPVSASHPPAQQTQQFSHPAPIHPVNNSPASQAALAAAAESAAAAAAIKAERKRQRENTRNLVCYNCGATSTRFGAEPLTVSTASATHASHRPSNIRTKATTPGPCTVLAPQKRYGASSAMAASGSFAPRPPPIRMPKGPVPGAVRARALAEEAARQQQQLLQFQIQLSHAQQQQLRQQQEMQEQPCFTAAPSPTPMASPPQSPPMAAFAEEEMCKREEVERMRPEAFEEWFENMVGGVDEMARRRWIEVLERKAMVLRGGVYH